MQLCHQLVRVAGSRTPWTGPWITRPLHVSDLKRFSYLRQISTVIIGNCGLYEMHWEGHWIFHKKCPNSWLFTTFSYILDILVNILTGLKFPFNKLSSFLKIGLTSAHFIISGKTFRDSDVFIKFANGTDNSLWANRIIFPGILS